MKLTVLLKHPVLYTIVLLLLAVMSCGIQEQKISRHRQSVVDSALDICRQFQTVPPDTLGKYSLLALTLLEHSDNRLYRAEAELWRAQYHVNTGNYDSAQFFSEKIMDQTLHAADMKDTLFIYNRSAITKGTAMYYKGEIKAAITWYYKILPKIEKDKDRNSYYRAYINIGLCNVALDRLRASISCYEKVYYADTKEVQPYLLAISYHNAGDSYANLGLVDSALKYENLALEIAQQNNYVVILNNALNTLGKVYYQHGDYEKARTTVLASMEKREDNPNLFYHVVDLCQLSRIYTALQKNGPAIDAAEKASEIAQENNLNTLYYSVGESLYLAYYGAGDYKKASERAYSLLEIMYKNDEQASAEAIAGLEAKYEAQKKEAQILRQKARIEKQEIIIAAAIGVFLLSAVTIFILFKNYRYQQKQKLQEVIIKEQDQAAKSIIQAEEAERKKISQNLHDSVGQLLSGLKLNLQALDERIETREEANIFQNSMKLLEESIHEIRNVSHQLLPNNIVRLGLAHSLQSLVKKINQDKLRIKFKTEGPIDIIGPDKQLMVYRILQESINNVIKHAHAEHMEILVQVTEDKLIASITDDGLGFDPAKAKTDAGIGLENINTRIRFLKGDMKIHSKAGRGTSLQFMIPLNHQA